MIMRRYSLCIIYALFSSFLKNLFTTLQTKQDVDTFTYINAETIGCIADAPCLDHKGIG